MKTKLINLFIFSFFLLTDFMVFAQGGPGDTGDGDGGLEGGDPEPVPINSKLVWLGILAIVFAFYQFRLKRKEA